MVVLQGPYDRPTPSVRKRRIPSCPSPALEATPDHRPPKRQKVCHPAVPPSRFWDDLSEIPLTRNALRELSNRNAKVSHCSPAIQTCCETSCHQPTDLLSPTDLRRITRFARHGGPDLKDLRGYPIPTGIKARMSSSQSGIRRRKRSSRSPKKNTQSPSKSNTTTTTRSTGPYDRAFLQHLIDHNILPDGYEYPDGRLPPEPENMDDILRALSRPRQSLSPSRFSKGDFRKFQREDAQASKERQVTTTIIPIIEGDVGDKKCVAGEIPFTNLDHLTDGTLVPGNPDIYYGARPEQLDRSIRKNLGGHVVPSTQEDFPVAPNFFVEVKGHDGSTAVAKRQLSYDMALGARGINSLQAYNSSNLSYDNRAYTLGCTYQAGIIKMYAGQPILPSVPGGQPGYNMTQLKVLALTNDPEAFRQGATAYRNGRDWAKRQRDDAINQANDRASHEMVESSEGDGNGLSFASEASASDTIVASQDIIPNGRSNVPSSEESEASADELSLDFHPPVKRRNSRSPLKKS